MNKPCSLLDIARHISEEKYRLIALRERLKTLLNDLPPRWHGVIKDEAHRIYAAQESWGHGEYEAHRLWKEYYDIRMAIKTRGRKYNPFDFVVNYWCRFSGGITKKFFIVTLLPAFAKNVGILSKSRARCLQINEIVYSFTMKNLITTAIPYMNGAPHVGHAFEMVLTDVIVRGRRLIGDDIFFLTGADEHGSKILKTAETQGIDVMKMLDENVARFQEMNAYLNVIPDGYLRTTDQKKHWPVVQALWMKLVEKGDIYKKQYAGYYCDREERFVTEAELDENKNVIEGGAPTRWAEDENYFFRLSKYSDTIKKMLSDETVGIVPEFRKNEMLSMIGDGLEDVSFSRTKKQLSWGIPVPNDEDHVMYVWCDALTNYISGSPENHENIDELFKNWSCDLHVIGKDIARFHCLTWIGMLLSAEIHLPKEILVHGFVNDKDGAKMSKSVGNVIDPHEMVQNYCSDTFRLYITGEVGVGQDLNFSDDRLRYMNNNILADSYGNLVNRVISLWIAFRDKEIPILSDSEKKGWDILYSNDPVEKIYPNVKQYKKALVEYNMLSAFVCIEGLLNEANSRLTALEPWKKSGKEKGLILANNDYGNLGCAGLVYVYYATLLLSPFIPEATEKVMKAMGIDPKTTLDTPMNIDLNTITKPDILFEKK